MKLACPVPHPWLPEREIVEVGEMPEMAEFQALARVNEQVGQVLASHAPESLTRRSRESLRRAVQGVFEALLPVRRARPRGDTMLSARSVLAPSADLKWDEIGLPEEMAWSLFAPLVIRETGDARILLIDGEAVPTALVRHPPADDHRGNISVGATTACRPLTDHERRVCETVGPVLRDKGLLFVGIDVIGGVLTEINVTSPTGIRELECGGASGITQQFLDAIARRIEITSESLSKE